MICTGKLARQLKGVIPILPIRFTATGVIDEISSRKVIEAAISDSVDGVALFGLASEYAKLTDSENG
jgi:2-keto-3-deoxy-L-arabinonate dehydratase